MHFFLMAHRLLVPWSEEWKSLSHVWLCDPIDCSPARLLCPWGFSRQEYWSGLPCPSLGDLPNLENEPTSLAWQEDSLPPSRLGGPCIVFMWDLPQPDIKVSPPALEAQRLIHCCSSCSVTKSCVTLWDPMDCTHQAPLSFTISWSLLMSIESISF